MAEIREVEGKSRTGFAQGEAEHLREEITTKGKSMLNEEKKAAADVLGTVANALRKSEQHLREQNASITADYFGRISQQMSQVASDLRERDLDTLLSRISAYSRSHPEAFFGIAIASGFFASRLLKSAAPAVAQSVKSEMEQAAGTEAGTEEQKAAVEFGPVVEPVVVEPELSEPLASEQTRKEGKRTEEDL